MLNQLNREEVLDTANKLTKINTNNTKSNKDIRNRKDTRQINKISKININRDKNRLKDILNGSRFKLRHTKHQIIKIRGLIQVPIKCKKIGTKMTSLKTGINQQ